MNIPNSNFKLRVERKIRITVFVEALAVLANIEKF